MQNKKSQYRSYIIVGWMMAILLVGNIAYIDAQGKSPATISSIQHELNDSKYPPPLQLGFRLVGTMIVGEKNSYALIEDEMTGKQGMYKLGESINECTVLKIDNESIIAERDGRTHILRITGGSQTEAVPSEIRTGYVPSSNGSSGNFPSFEPVLRETGPPVNEDVSVGEFPHFDPINNNTGPTVDGDVHEDLPEFERFISYTEQQPE